MVVFRIVPVYWNVPVVYRIVPVVYRIVPVVYRIRRDLPVYFDRVPKGTAKPPISSGRPPNARAELPA